jgi:DNA-binding XRE family transcriptional regulator
MSTLFIEATHHRRRLHEFLKELRTRISPQAKVLGPFSRLPSRRGRIVSQKELAECIGVSRAWYATLESNGGVRPSPALLDRLAAALMLTQDERKSLFNLAFPEEKLKTRLVLPELRSTSPTSLSTSAAPCW